MAYGGPDAARKPCPHCELGAATSSELQPREVAEADEGTLPESSGPTRRLSSQARREPVSVTAPAAATLCCGSCVGGRLQAALSTVAAMNRRRPRQQVGQICNCSEGLACIRSAVTTERVIAKRQADGGCAVVTRPSMPPRLELHACALAFEAMGLRSLELLDASVMRSSGFAAQAGSRWEGMASLSLARGPCAALWGGKRDGHGPSTFRAPLLCRPRQAPPVSSERCVLVPGAAFVFVGGRGGGGRPGARHPGAPA